ncbi:MAG TPA: lactate utilization protein [Elusimicrobiales bacterium]|nr:lactate utilization protein [Elusimicrobiales bacterium]
MDENLKKAGLKMLEAAAAALKKNNFASSVHPDAPAAAAYLVKMVGAGKTAGFGGSVTLASLELQEKLRAAGNTVLTHAPGMDKEARRGVWAKAQAADFYFASPQALTMRGELLLLDGNGNRISACACGPRKVVLVAGVNKLVKDLDAGLWRMRNVAALANNIRLNKENPCVKTGKCEDCASPQRICNALLVLYKKPSILDMEIVLVNEELGY